MRAAFEIIGAASLFLLLSTSDLFAADIWKPQSSRAVRSWAATFYAAKLSDKDVLGLTESAVTGSSFKFRDAWFVGLGVSKTLNSGLAIPNLLSPSNPVSGFRIEAEVQILKHFGLENFTEVAAAPLIRTPTISLFGVQANFAIGDGLSYAFQHPKLESGSTRHSGVDTPKLLNFMLIEGEFTSAALPNFHFILTLHHRCGVWGVVAPRWSGSNYIGFGLRFDD